MKHKDGIAVFRAEIKLAEGAVATGWGSRRDAGEEGNSSADLSLSYITEAENQALGRALAVLGYGIEYATDFDVPAEGEPIPLREEQSEEEISIEVPMNDVDVVGDEEAEEVAGTIQVPETTTVEDQNEGAAEEQESVPSKSRPAVFEEPGRYSSEPTPFRPSRQPVPGQIPPTLITAHPAANRRPGSETPAPPTINPAPITNPAVEERIKEITDSQLVLAIKQIFHEARRLHSLSEDAVDRSSLKRYGVPVKGLSIDQANEYLERIKAAPRTPKK
jgi:hypothetical protein